MYEGKPLFHIQPDSKRPFGIQPLLNPIGMRKFMRVLMILIGERGRFSIPCCPWHALCKYRVRPDILVVRNTVSYLDFRCADCVIDRLLTQ